MQQTIATPYQMGQILAAGRRRAGLTQAEAASRLGVSQSRISTLETDSGALTLDQLLTPFGPYEVQLQVLAKVSSRPALPLSPPGWDWPDPSHIPERCRYGSTA